MKLSKAMLDKIVKASEDMDYGSITIHIADHMGVIDIEINERLRYEKECEPRAGQVISKKQAIIHVSREDTTRGA